MKDVYEVLRQKEAEVASVRDEIQSLKLVSSLLSDELPVTDARELLRRKEADVARVRHEIENLRIAAPLLSEAFALDELPQTLTDSTAEEDRDIDDRPKATGTDGLFSSLIVDPRPTLWKLLRRKT